MFDTTSSVYSRIYTVVRQIPAGRVATYGQIAQLVGGCTPRMVGYALASLSFADAEKGNVPWQRVINAQGKISPRGGSDGAQIQRDLLEAEGVRFDGERINLLDFRWDGPSWAWLAEHGFEPERGADQLGYWEGEEEIERRVRDNS